MLARDVVEGFCSGLHKSPHKGFSVEFKEHRAYAPGDDLRTIDWKLFGKTDRLYIREREEETNLRCTLLVDASGSMAYRGSRATMSKFDYASRAAAGLAYLLIRQQDSVGLMTFDSAIREHIPPRARPKHLSLILAALDRTAPGEETDLGPVFRAAAPRLADRGLLVIFSDLFGDLDALKTAIAHFRHAKHEVIVFQTFDPDELDFPFRDWTQFASLEGASVRHTVDPAQVRASYLAKLADFRDRLTAECSRQRVTLVPLSTDRPPSDALAEFVAMRRRTP